MRLASVLTPMSDENLCLAAQSGVTDIVDRYRGSSLEELVAARQRVEAFDMKLSVIEGYLPIEKIKVGRDDGAEIEAMKTLVHNMGRAGIPILCYNFMAGTDWVRTRLDIPSRGGAAVTGFRLRDLDQAVLLGHDSAGVMDDDDAAPISADQLWQNLESLLRELLPVAERSGVVLAMHPDDPPLPEFRGKSRIMHTVEGFQRLVDLVPSPSNGICFCQGSFATMGADIPEAIRRLGPHIRYVHFRDVAGAADDFVETFHDNGPTDMVAAMQAYRDVGFDGPIRPDHVPQLVGEEDGQPGYTIKGRLFAWGYLRGLMQATQPQSSHDGQD